MRNDVGRCPLTVRRGASHTIESTLPNMVLQISPSRPGPLMRTCALVFLSSAFALLSSLAQALAPTDLQGHTLKQMLDLLEDRHYSRTAYDDDLSSLHLDAYLKDLDPQKMFFTQADINDFERWRHRLDDTGHDGDLTPAFTIFERYQTALIARLERVLVELPSQIAGFDYTIEEYISLDGDSLSWAVDSDELDDRWRKRIKNQALSLRIAGKEQEELIETLSRRYRGQLSRLDQYNERDVFAVYANALTELYDPHTSYFSPRRAENFDINMSLSFDGIGAVLQIDDEYTKVSRIVPAGPADKQGELKAADLIIGVGQGVEGPLEDVIGWRLDEVVDLIRGERGTTVRIEVIPDQGKMDQRHTIAIVRNEVKLEEQAAQSQLLEIPDENGNVRKVGVIELPTFYIDFAALRRGEKDYKSSTRDVKRLIDELQAEGAEALVIDLRNNGGGSLQEANDLTGLFIEYGPTVQIRSAERRVWRDGKRRRSAYYEGPLAVMINRLSASASEIFAGAIQDYGRGIVVGDQSFGKGTVQTLVALPEGQLKVTESKFYRISGDSTQNRGVLPDISYPSLFDPDDVGESALPHALPWDQISAVRHREYDSFGGLVSALASRHESRVETDPDLIFLNEQVAMALESRSIDRLPLAEVERRAMRDQQEQRALAIENRRREAKGLESLDSLDSSTAALDTGVSNGNAVLEQSSGAATEDLSVEEDSTETDDDSDVLLLETGRILADAINLKREQNQTASR
jgi:carboxyl-terminal processing protease